MIPEQILRQNSQIMHTTINVKTMLAGILLSITPKPSAKVDDISKATPYFANAAKAVLAGEKPDPAVTKPYGCSIKY